MEILQFKKELTKILPCNIVQTNFIIYNSDLDIFVKIPSEIKTLTINTEFVIPICIRFGLYSHCAIFISFDSKLYYYDPDKNPLKNKLRSLFLSIFKQQIVCLKTNTENNRGDCSFMCLQVLRNFFSSSLN